MLLLPEKEEDFVTGHRLQVLFMCLILWLPNHVKLIVRRRRKSFNLFKFNSLDKYTEYEIASA